MRINKIRAQNFRSIIDSNEVSLDDKITILIGKNEQGKTNILKALESFKSDYSYKSDDLCYLIGTTEKSSELPIVTIWFNLDKDDKDSLGDISDRFENCDELVITKYFDNHYEINKPNMEDYMSKFKDSIKRINELLEKEIHEIKHSKTFLDRVDYEKHIEWILSLQGAEGGFGHVPGKQSNVVYSYYAVKTLLDLGELNRIDKEKVVRFIKSSQHNNGGFGASPNQQPSVDFTYSAIKILKELNALNEIDKKKNIDWLKSLQNLDGGFTHIPGRESHIAHAYPAVNALGELGGLKHIDKEKLIQFTLKNQHPNGGFGSLPHQESHPSFTYNSIRLLNELKVLDQINLDKHIDWVKSLQNADGGFGDNIGKPSHIANTYYAIKTINEFGDLNNIDTKKLIQYIISCQDPNGGFSYLSNQKPNGQFTYHAFQILKVLQNHFNKIFNDSYSELKTSNDPERSIHLIDKIMNVVNIHPNGEISKIYQYLDNEREVLKNLTMPNIIKSLLIKVPNFIYFNSVDLLEDSMKIDEYFVSEENHKTFRNLLKLAEVKMEEVKKGKFYHRRRYLDRASARTTKLINNAWEQENVEVKIGIDGDHIFIIIEDEVGAHDQPSKRSDGFQWYLSFYINFITGTKKELKNTIILLDNVGQLLHPSGQKDLLIFLDKISDSNQIIFATHSPYLIDRNNFDRIRIVEKERKRSTIIKEKFHVSNFDAFEPIRTAIGTTIADSLFGSKENLLVEGLSDYYILEGITHYLKRNDRESIDLSKISIIPVGGANKVPYFALFLWKEGYKTIILLDNDENSRKVIKNLKEKYPIDEKQIINVDEIKTVEQGKENKTLADLIDPTFYNRAINETYKELLREKLGKEEINIRDIDNSIGMLEKRYSEFFKEKNLGSFDKILVAKEIRNIAIDKSCTADIICENTLNNFEKLFKIINDRLR